ncbi:MAG: hypothetical protein AVDCRST_MAG18-3364, partial [uncultured Thermomicrobiales bacterium]
WGKRRATELASWRISARSTPGRSTIARLRGCSRRSLAGRPSLLRSGVGASPAVSQDVPSVAERVARLEVLATA